MSDCTRYDAPMPEAATATTDATAAADSAAAINPTAIRAAMARITGDVRRTPLWKLPGHALGVPCEEVWLKLEQLQVSGSFKARGMFNHLRSVSAPPAGVVIASAGNAGIAAAWAARALNLRCEVFVPESTSMVKRERLVTLGAQVTVSGATYADAVGACTKRQEATGALLLHAYDLPEMVVGAGTLALEIEAQAGVPDRVLVSVGGGGLVAGIAAWFEGCARVEALEPGTAPTLHAAMTAGEPTDVTVSGICVDSLGARRIGNLTWPFARRHVAASHLLADSVIAAAQKRIWVDLRLAVEPAAALPLAALWSRAVRPAPDEKVAVILCGANFDPGYLL
jgi:threonine dehydratase